MQNFSEKHLQYLSGKMKYALRENYWMKYMKFRKEITRILTQLEEQAMTLPPETRQDEFIKCARRLIKDCISKQDQFYKDSILWDQIFRTKSRSRNRIIKKSDGYQLR